MSKKQNQVFVINMHGEALMPCSPRKAKKLLESGKAKVINKYPFTIQLLHGSSGYKQQIKVGVDTGQRHIGLAVVRDDVVLWQGEIELRQDVKGLLETRKSYRRGRRYRNTRYRKPRFANRMSKYNKVESWLPPSVNQKIQHNINWIEKLTSYLPECDLTIEVGKFDMQKMQNPDIKGIGYQQGDQYGYENVKYYVLDRDKYTCQVCKKRGNGIKLKVHHIIYRCLGGTNRASNLMTVCSDCHTAANHKEGGRLYKLMKDKKKMSESYKGATFMNILRRRIFKAFEGRAKFTYGYWTLISREKLGLAKGHFNDAIAIAVYDTQTKMQQPKDVVMIKQFRNRKRSLHEATARKGRKEPNTSQKRNAKNTKVVGMFSLNDRVKLPNGLVGYISGFTGKSAYVQDISGKYLQLSDKYKQNTLSKLKILGKNNNWQFQSIKLSSYEFK